MPKDRKPVIRHAPSYAPQVPVISPRVRRLGEALNPRKRFERAMLEGRVPMTRSGLRYAQGSSLMDPPPDPSPKRSIWDARFGAPTEGLTPAQNLWLLANAATFPVTGTLGLVGLGALYGSGFAPDIPAGERVDPETGETIPATKIKDMFKKENRMPGIRQNIKEGHKGIAALQALGIGLPAALAAYTRGGIGGLRGTGSKAVADEVADEMRRTVLKGGAVGAAAAVVGPKLLMSEKLTRGAARVAPTASKFKRIDFGGFTDTLNKLGVPPNTISSGYRFARGPNRGFEFKGNVAEGPSLMQSVHNRRMISTRVTTPSHIHRAGLAERTAAELKALNLQGRYGIQAENMTKVQRGFGHASRSRFEKLGTFKPAHTSGEGIGQLKIFEINGVPVVQDVKGALFIPNPEGVISLQNFELAQFASRMGHKPTSARLQLMENQPGIDVAYRRGQQYSIMDKWRQTGGITQREKEIFKAWENAPVAGRGDTGGNLVKVGEYVNPWERIPRTASELDHYTVSSGGFSHNLEGVPVHRSGGHFKTPTLGPRNTLYGPDYFYPRWDYLAKPK